MVDAAVGECFGDVAAVDGVGPGQIGDGARDAQDAVIAARGHLRLFFACRHCARLTLESITSPGAVSILFRNGAC